MKYIFGNWKMYLDYDESVDLANKLSSEDLNTKDIQLGVFPSALAVKEVTDIMEKSSFIVGSQDVGFPSKGAYTGLVSAYMFKNVGCTHALVGHSERRHIFGETNEDVRKKLEACIDEGLIPVLCIGETKEDKSAGKTQYRLKKQMMKALEGLDLNGSEFIIAYEPVWAIGTGDACLPQDSEDIMGWIKQEVQEYIKEDIPVLYGGSVSPDNAASYVLLDSVGGVLVGGASAKADSFISLIQSIK